MAYDGFVNKAIVNELKQILIGGKVTKIHQPNRDELILNIYSNSNKYNLDICISASNCRLNITSQKKSNPLNPTSFCMLLRKHLIGSKIKKIDTIGLDRIIQIDFETFNELNDIINKKLIIELMGKHSNIILINDNDMIIDSIRHITADRNILPANPYFFPCSNKLNIDQISFQEFEKVIMDNSDNFVNIISYNFYGFSKSLINYVVHKFNIDTNKMSTDSLNIFYTYILNLINKINSLEVECSEFAINNKTDYVLIPTENPSELKINTCLDNYYTSKEKNEYFENYRNLVLKSILSILKKYDKRLDNINSKLQECKDMEKYKLYGELITANLYKINNNNLEEITLENYYDNNNSITIPLDKKYSPANNAKRFFKKYSKQKNTLEVVTIQKKDTKREIEYIESIIYSLEIAKNIDEIDDIYVEIQENLLNKKIKNNKKDKKTKETSSPITLNIDGYTVMVGKNNKQNDLLTFKLSSKNDLWFHTKDVQGSHVVLKVNTNQEIPNLILLKCASIAAYHSKSRASSKVLVEYTLIKNIKKPKNSKPGFVTFTNYKTVLVEPIKYNS